jgi:LysM repeat protein
LLCIKYHFNARWYDAQTARFVSEDPARDGVSWFAYVGNNPLRYVDPTGLISWDTFEVDSGDTLSEIVSEANEIAGTDYDVADIAELNEIADIDLIYPGQIIIVPNELHEKIREKFPIGENYADPAFVSEISEAFIDFFQEGRAVEATKEMPLYLDVGGAVSFLPDTNSGGVGGYFLNAWGIYQYKGVEVFSDSLSIDIALHVGIGKVDEGISGGVQAAAGMLSGQIGPGFTELGVGTSGIGVSVYSVYAVSSWVDVFADLREFLGR